MLPKNVCILWFAITEYEAKSCKIMQNQFPSCWHVVCGEMIYWETMHAAMESCKIIISYPVYFTLKEKIIILQAI